MTVQRFVYKMGRPILWLVSIMPFWVLHGLSDFMCLIVMLVGYRKSVIDQNLKYSFPNKEPKELVRIRNRFYRHFCDLFVETLKTQTISKEGIKKRMVFVNTELIEKYAAENKDVIIVMAHYCNWEWVTSINLHVSPLGTAVYHPLKNKNMDQFMKELRSKFGSVSFKMKATMREVVGMKRKNQRFVLGLISDQSPARPKIQYRTKFLNQNTPIHLGAEKIAKATNDPVVYLRVEKVARSRYVATIVPVVDRPKETVDFEITEKHVRMLENQIIEKPEYWLWSHKRWKFSPNRLAVDVESLSIIP